MNTTEEDLVHEPGISLKPPGQKCTAGTLFHYFQKKAGTANSITPEVKCDEVTETPGGPAEGSEDRKNGTCSSQQEPEDSQHANCEPAHHEATQGKDATHRQKCENSSSEKKKLINLTGKPNCDNHESEKANQDVSEKKKDGKGETNSSLCNGMKKPSQNPFQILMESGKKKGVWDKPAVKTKEAEGRSSEDECIEVESEAPVRSAVEQGSAKYFSIFSKKMDKNLTDTALSNDAKAEASTKAAELKKPAKQSEFSKSSAGKSKPSGSVHKLSLDAKKSPKRDKPSTEGNAKESKLEKTRDCKSPDGKKAECSAAVRKGNRTRSVYTDDMETDMPATPRRSRLKVARDSDFEPDNVQSGKRKGRTPSKSQGSNSKRPRTDSLSRSDADSSSKPATLFAAQKLVKKSRNQKRSGDSSRRDSAPSDKPGPKQTLLTAGRKEPLAADVQPDTGSPRRRSGRPRPERRHQPSDSELEFTPGRRVKGRQREAEAAEVKNTPGRKSERKRALVKPAAEPSGSELEATPVKKSAQRASAGGQRRKQSSGAGVEVPSTKKKSRHPSADVVEISPEKRPAERRSSRPRRPVIFSESEGEPSPAKPARRSRAARSSARPVTPTDSEAETTPVKKPARRSSRPSRPVRRLSDSEVELSPLKKPSRGGGRRSAAAAGAAAAAADEPEVVLVRSRSAGAKAAGARPDRSGVDAFQMMRRGGRPPKQTAAEKAASEARRAFLSSGVPESLQVQAEVARRLEESLTPLFPEVSHVHQRVGEEATSPPESRPLPAGLRWRTEPPAPPLPARPAPACGLVPGLAGRLRKMAGSDGSVGGQVVDVGADGDSGAGDADPDPVRPTATPGDGDTGEPASSVASSALPSAPSVPRLPCLSFPDCTDALRDLLSADREHAAPAPASAATAAVGPAVWTDLFRPRHQGAFVGGWFPADALQDWLADWSVLTAWEDDGSEEPAGDGTMLLLGPTGCGKTSAVYAAAGQLGFQVLEVSASSRRSGRHLSSQLSEATQSQRVSMLGGGGALSVAEPPSRSLLLLEDVQLVSEDLDDGFLAAAASLAAAAKRPVVLTSGDPAVTRTRLLRALPHRLLIGVAPPSVALRRQLALVALTQGWLLPEEAAARLAEGRDVRQALLQLQWLCEGHGDRGKTETVNTRQALTEAQLEKAEEFMDQLPAVLKVVRLGDEPGAVEVPQLPSEPAGRRESGWRPPVRQAAAGYDGQTRHRWRCVDPDLFSDDDGARPAPSPTPAPTAGAPDGVTPERVPPEERALLSASVAALADLWELRSACDALVTPAERCVMGSWWQRRPQADMTETEQPRCVTEERGEQLGRQLAEEALRTAGRRCAGQLRAARAEFSACGRSEPTGLRLPLYDEEGVREAAWDQGSRLMPTVPSLLLSRRAATADLLPSIRRICRLECVRRVTDGGRTRRFLHYFDQMGLHAVPTSLRTQMCESLM